LEARLQIHPLEVGGFHEDAKDLTQEFFTAAFEKAFFDPYDPKKSRFRTFLRTCVDGLVANARKAAGRIKRGGDTEILSLDFEAAEIEGVIHRDLKPSNIMIGDFGEVLVIDWGLAKVLPKKRAAGAPAPQAAVPLNRTAERAQTLHGVVLGTPGYMAPEQEHGEIDSIDERTDVYGLGVLLGFLMPAGTPRSVRAHDGQHARREVSPRHWMQHLSCVVA